MSYQSYEQQHLRANLAPIMLFSRSALHPAHHPKLIYDCIINAVCKHYLTYY